MANPKHVKKFREGVKPWNRWREQNPTVIPDLSGVDLGGPDVRTDLSNANLSKVDLSRAGLSFVNLTDTDLSRANLNGTSLIDSLFIGTQLEFANLAHAHLGGARFHNVDLRGANLAHTTLDYTSFKDTDLAGTDFTGAQMHHTDFADVDLSKTKGLETIDHSAPSTIGIDTIEFSQGKIPEVFLRGAGVSDEFIAFIRAMGGAIQFYSCFISYSSKDQLFAERIYEGLQAKGVRCWFAPHEMQGGKKLYEQIDDAIRVHERLLLILSPESINSEWVKTEIAKARKREVVEKRRMLFPVLLKISYKELQKWECFDADTGKDSAREIREYYIPDFSEWERPEKFKEEFEKLVRDLKKAEAVK
jgi:uncharacterized protein YjbI with pentapeptide repeats